MKEIKYYLLGIFLFFALLPVLSVNAETVSGEINAQEVSGQVGEAKQYILLYMTAQALNQCVTEKLLEAGYGGDEINMRLPILWFAYNNGGNVYRNLRFWCPGIARTGNIVNDAANQINTANAGGGPADIYLNRVRGAMLDAVYASSNSTRINCVHNNKYNYAFDYEHNKDNSWVPISDNKVNKCEEVRLKFTPNAEWFASFEFVPGSFNITLFDSPPADFLACSDQNDCLSKGTEYSLTPDTLGKGVQKIPANFVGTTEQSLTSSNSNIKCSNGICISYTSGTFPLSATAPATSYFGQCRGYGATINTPEVSVPAVTSNNNLTVLNLPPVANVSFEKDSIIPDGEVNVTCDIVDPDECSDKIAKVKWTCSDSNGNSSNCSFLKTETNQWARGTFTDYIDSSKQNNPYRATTKFKASQIGNYAVTCEATDNDINNPLTGTGIAGIRVVQGCEPDGICNPNCPNDPDCGVVPAASTYCAVISPNGGSNNTVCGSTSAQYKAYSSGIEPQTYKWKCSSADLVKETATPDFTCNYSGKGIYTPSLSIVGKDGKETQCVSQVNTEITDQSSCQTQVRKAGTKDDFVSSLTILAEDKVEARITLKCLKGGTASWNVSNGTILNQQGDTSKIQFNSSAAFGQVKATITDKQGSNIVCGSSNIEIKEKIQFGN